jgi:hypothetical protein
MTAGGKNLSSEVAVAVAVGSPLGQRTTFFDLQQRCYWTRKRPVQLGFASLSFSGNQMRAVGVM